MNNIAGALYRVIKIKNEMKCSRRMRSCSVTPVSVQTAMNNIVLLKSGLEVTQGH